MDLLATLRQSFPTASPAQLAGCLAALQANRAPITADALYALLQPLLPTLSAAELASGIAALLTALATGNIIISVGDNANWQNSPIHIGDTYNTTIATPAAPDPLQAALAVYATLPPNDVPPRDPTALAASSHLPHAPLDIFVGRHSELSRIASAFAASTPPAQLVTLAGIMSVGKTALALEFAYRYGRFFQGGVFWIDASEPDTILSSIAQCGITMGLFSAIPQIDLAVQQVVLAWQAPVPRLLIFDNSPAAAASKPYWPKFGGCRVLMTTRSTPASTRHTIHVRTLRRDQSVELLQALAPELSTHAATQLARWVDDLPLGLFLAGRYLGYYGMAASEYLSNLSLNHRSFTAASLPEDEPDGAHSQRNIQAVINLAVARLHGANPSGIDQFALSLLERLCWLAPGEPLAQPLLQDCLDQPGIEHTVDAIMRLQNLGLLEAREQHTSVFHTLTQRALAPEYATASARTSVVRALARHLEQANHQGLPLTQPALANHAQWVAQQLGVTPDADSTELRLQLGRAFHLQGRYQAADALYTQVIHAYGQPGSLNATARLDTMLHLAELARSSDAMARAATLLEQVLAELQDAADAARRISAMTQLGQVYSHMHRYSESEALLREALARSTQAWGGAALQTAACENALALTLYHLWQYAEAEPLFQSALAMRSSALGRQHPETLMTLNNLAMLYTRQRHYAQAEPLLLEVLAQREQRLGAEHPETARSLNNLAYLYAIQGQASRARPLYEQALAIREAVLGPHHRETAASYHDLSMLDSAHYHRDLEDEALALLQDYRQLLEPDTYAQLELLLQSYRDLSVSQQSHSQQAHAAQYFFISNINFYQHALNEIKAAIPPEESALFYRLRRILQGLGRIRDFDSP